VARTTSHRELLRESWDSTSKWSGRDAGGFKRDGPHHGKSPSILFGMLFVTLQLIRMRGTTREGTGREKRTGHSDAGGLECFR
jgi:hypothetical protein